MTTDLNGELRFWNLPDRKRSEPLTLEFNPNRDTLGSTLGSPIHGTETMQESNLRGRSQDTQSLEPSHGFHTQLLKPLHYLYRIRMSRKIRGTTANPTRAVHVSKTLLARVSGPTNDLRNSILALQVK